MYLFQYGMSLQKNEILPEEFSTKVGNKLYEGERKIAHWEVFTHFRTVRACPLRTSAAMQRITHWTDARLQPSEHCMDTAGDEWFVLYLYTHSQVLQCLNIRYTHTLRILVFHFFSLGATTLYDTPQMPLLENHSMSAWNGGIFITLFSYFNLAT